ncbi:hypothetical protein TNCV_2736871 [Trichonephila clavipes]|nr:hypothetical protein TNCV_2736871 [Trichonephila clavipes]
MQSGPMHIKYVEAETSSFRCDAEVRGGVPPQLSGQGIGSWLACHEFEPSTTKELKRPLVDVVVRRGECQLRCHPRHLTMIQNYEVRCQKTLV